MPNCEFLPKCPFYNDRMDAHDGLGALYKARYCVGDSSICARYRVSKALGSSAVPVDLFPNMHKQADKIIAAGKTKT